MMQGLKRLNGPFPFPSHLLHHPPPLLCSIFLCSFSNSFPPLSHFTFFPAFPSLLSPLFLYPYSPLSNSLPSLVPVLNSFLSLPSPIRLWGLKYRSELSQRGLGWTPAEIECFSPKSSIRVDNNFSDTGWKQFTRYRYPDGMFDSLLRDPSLRPQNWETKGDGRLVHWFNLVELEGQRGAWILTTCVNIRHFFYCISIGSKQTPQVLLLKELEKINLRSISVN